jgi:hypothetical protein
MNNGVGQWIRNPSASCGSGHPVDQAAFCIYLNVSELPAMAADIR